jgi:hypothetical protein
MTWTDWLRQQLENSIVFNGEVQIFQTKFFSVISKPVYALMNADGHVNSTHPSAFINERTSP